MTGFFDRFVHPRLAKVATTGAVIWIGSFFVAAIGLLYRATGQVAVGGFLFFLSGLIGLAGIVVLGLCTCWLIGAWIKAKLLTRPSP